MRARRLPQPSGFSFGMPARLGLPGRVERLIVTLALPSHGLDPPRREGVAGWRLGDGGLTKASPHEPRRATRILSPKRFSSAQEWGEGPHRSGGDAWRRCHFINLFQEKNVFRLRSDDLLRPPYPSPPKRRRRLRVKIERSERRLFEGEGTKNNLLRAFGAFGVSIWGQSLGDQAYRTAARGKGAPGEAATAAGKAPRKRRATVREGCAGGPASDRFPDQPPPHSRLAARRSKRTLDRKEGGRSPCHALLALGEKTRCDC